MRARRILSLLSALAILLIAGCATRKIDWAARVGSYSFDQAVAELGPPEKQAKLSDGTLVAEWLLRRGYREVYATGVYHPGYYYHHHGILPPAYAESYRPDYLIRLTFSPEGQLTAWKRYSR